MKTRQWAIYGGMVAAVIALLASCGGHESSSTSTDTTSLLANEPLSLAKIFEAKYGAPPTVTVSVQASDAFGNALSYEWKATDGTIANLNSSSTTWTLPAGPGLHFAYVLVSNGKGGYTERRVAVNTDTIGIPKRFAPALAFRAPAAAAQTGMAYRSVIRADGYYLPPPDNDSNGIYIPDASVYLQNTVTGVQTATVNTDARGSFTFQDVQPGTYDEYCSMNPGDPFDLCRQTSLVFQNEALHDPFHGPSPGRGDYVGRMVLTDGEACGTVNEFFGKTVVGQATLLDAAGATLAGPFRINAWGHYGFSLDANAASVKLECEGVAPVTVAISEYATATPRTVLAGTAAPVITTMSAKLNGAEVGLFLPPPSGQPSNNVADAEFFLSSKGIDSRISACQYYLAVGAVKTCDAQGKLGGAISFDDWKRKMRMDPFRRTSDDNDRSAARTPKEIVATYINRVDLNLTRNHHSISYGPNQVSAYVCNHLGPANETQAAADVAIDNAVNGKNLVACVAMDYSVTLGVNGNKPFTRFLIFGPSGELLPSVNLDGRREKFVPGVCVACHGAEKYAGVFPESGGFANIGAHFVPYDVGNFTFSTKPGLTQVDLESAIHTLNTNVLQSGPSIAISELIQGWYANGTGKLDTNYLPVSWRTRPVADQTFYKEVYAHSCRTCHVAFTEALNFDHYDNFNTPSEPVGEDGALRTSLSVCGGSSSFVRTFSMPNSLRTHDLFWGSAGTAIDQPALLSAFLGNQSPCTIHVSPNP
jgi:hypothetical protein